MAKESSRSVENRWNKAAAPSDPVDLLVYASNLLGSDPKVTNFGGGNTSSKVKETDPLTGESVEVLWVKASGGDLGSAKRGNFASLYQDKVVGLESRYKGGLTEDEIVSLYMRTVFDNNPAAPSIDTPLHAFVPAKCVAHMHSDAVIAVAASHDAERLLHEIYGSEMGYLPWKRPGFELGLMLRDLIAANPGINSALMGQHGFISWADTWEECYRLTIDLINKAVKFIEKELDGASTFDLSIPSSIDSKSEILKVLPELRGKVAYQGQRLIANVDTSDAVLGFTKSRDFAKLAQLGTSCPDHFLRTKIRPMVLPVGTNLDAALAEFREGYGEYYRRCVHANSPAMRNPNPSVVLIPEVGMISFGKNPQEARITGEFYRNAIEVMRGAEAISNYVSLPEQEAFDIEYWLLEEAKLKRQPAEQELSRQVVLLVGAGPGIGTSIAERLLKNGASVVVADLNEKLVSDATGRLQAEFGKHAVAGVTLDKTNRASVRAAIDDAVIKFGGLDVLIDIAAVFIPPDLSGRISDSAWAKTYEINLVGTYILADEVHNVMKRQGTPAKMVFVSSANAVVSKAGSVAYDTSKAAVNHLVRELAIEYAPLVRVNAIAPATVVAGSQMFPRDRVLSSLVKYKIEYENTDTDDELRDKLAGFYAKRTLLKQAVTPATVADGAYLLATDRLSQTTGHIVPVDAGLSEAFLR